MSQIESSPAIEIVGVSKYFGEVAALSNVSVTIEQGEFFGILGPSGCGKTTLLRIIGGLELPDSGHIRLCGEDSASIPAYRRPVHTVFQSYALFPHMTVRANIAFGLKMKQLPSQEIEERVDRIMQITQTDRFADRKPSQLSGGQQQRVALARAAVNEPKVLLLDEPLGALDLKLRKELQVELMALQRRLNIAFVLVTHDQEEALTMCSRIAVMNVGRIEQLGDVESLYERPRTRFVSSFLGTSNILDVRVRERSENTVTLDTALGTLTMPSDSAIAERSSFSVALRPEKITLNEVPTGEATNEIPCTVKELIYIGSETHYVLDANGFTLSAEAMNIKVGSQGLDLNEKAFAVIPPGALIPLDD